MPQKTDDNKSFVQQNDELYNKKTRAVVAPKDGEFKNNDIVDDIIELGDASKVDMGEINAFTSISQKRDELYALIDVMAEDSTISAVLETYVEDATERNDSGNIVWCESSDQDIQKFITFLLDDLSVDKYVYGWVYQLCKYGDVYLKLFHKSEVEDDLFKDKEPLNEAIKIRAYSPKDKFVHFVEAVSNPAEYFELTKFGKTAGYIQAPIFTPKQYTSMGIDGTRSSYSYRFRRGDITLFGATEFVHAALEDTTNRTNEEVSIFTDDNEDLNDGTPKYNYTVRRGQSLLYDSYKLWRELQLLENAILLNRVTRSSIIRLIQIEVGDMPKHKVPDHLRKLKSIIEQKSALNESVSMSEYNNPGPVENIVYVPTRGGVGNITMQNVGGDDVNVGQLTDLDYFKNKLYGSLRVPKQYFGETDDSGGFDGGTSLSIISSRYAKMIKRIQTTMIQAITDLLNIYLLDKGLDSYLGKFKICMLAPTTREEIDRRDNLSGKIQLANDVLGMVSDLETIPRLLITKALLANIIDNPEVLAIIDDEISKMEIEESSDNEDDDESFGNDFGRDDESSDRDSFDSMNLNDLSTPSGNDLSMDMDETPSGDIGEVNDINASSLPSMENTGIDFSDNTAEI